MRFFVRVLKIIKLIEYKKKKNNILYRFISNTERQNIKDYQIKNDIDIQH